MANAATSERKLAGEKLKIKSNLLIFITIYSYITVIIV